MSNIILANSNRSAAPVTLGTKDPGDSQYFYFDFTAWLPNGVTVVSAITTTKDPSGMDDSASMILNAAQITNNTAGIAAVAQQMIAAGTLGVNYTVSCKATFSDGQTETLSAILPIGPVYGTAS